MCLSTKNNECKQAIHLESTAKIQALLYCFLEKKKTQKTWTCAEAWLVEYPMLYQTRLIITPYLTNGFSHHYHLGESTSVLRGIGVIFRFYSIFR